MQQAKQDLFNKYADLGQTMTKISRQILNGASGWFLNCYPSSSTHG